MLLLVLPSSKLVIQAAPPAQDEQGISVPSSTPEAPTQIPTNQSNENSANQIFLPFVIETESQGSPADTPKRVTLRSQEWLTFHSPELHISFQYPSDWQLEIPDFDETDAPTELAEDDPYTRVGYVVGIVPPKDGVLAGKKIEITTQSFEIPQGQTLQEWHDDLQAIHNLSHHGTHSNPDFKSIDITSEELREAREPEQILHVVREHVDIGLLGQTVFITQGRIVYLIAVFGHNDEFENIVASIAGSIQFDADAPTDLNSLHGPDFSSKSLKETVSEFERLFTGIEGCGIVCRDENALEALNPTPEARTESEEQAVRAAAVSHDQKALPANWFSPIAPSGSTTYPVFCGSGAHGGNSEFAVDAVTPVWTSVYAAAGGTVILSWYDPNENPITETSYGNIIQIQTNLNIADENRQYFHAYAHLNSRGVNQGNTVNRNQWIGLSGDTGNVGPHLHFHIRDAYNNPVDASPLIGFQPNLNYPEQEATCGQIKPRSSSEIIIEPVAFTQRYQPRDNHYWFCLSTYNIHTNECRMKGEPNNGFSFNSINPPQYISSSPELRYNVYIPQSATYRIWVCGHGANSNDDLVHLGYNNGALSSTIQLTGWGTPGWSWRSIRTNNTVPTFAGATGDRTVNVWMGEDGFNIDRIVLTPSVLNNNPPSHVACGGH